MNKIIVNPVGDIFVTSDGKVILKEMDVLHPLVTSLKKLAESMDKACGDGTKTAVIFASNLIKNAVKLIRQECIRQSLSKDTNLPCKKPTRCCSTA